MASITCVNALRECDVRGTEATKTEPTERFTTTNGGWRWGSLRRLLVECRRIGGAIEASDVGALPLFCKCQAASSMRDEGGRDFARDVSCQGLLLFVPALLHISNVMLHCPRDQR